ncbi:MAG: winged helix-turn-helix transcriptional regulator [Gracilimonas sp.]|uniref:winged helix-turn-helix transcriptional regulator n=1 Tax=Gracilimonas sp. TaxID=1974203 RepID=UPI0037530DCD|nr:winged helix-turn-helix transcriptional regulator [Gracilimonas sp.]
MTEQEKYLRDLMQKNQVSQSEIAEHEGISEQAVNQQLLRLTPSKVKHLKAIIIELSKQKNC